MKWYPKFLQNFFLPITEGFLRTPYISVVREWQQLEKLDAESIRHMQKKKLEHLLMHAVTNVPAYRSLSVDASLKNFFIATKSLYRENEDQWIASHVKKEHLVVEKSSGSSGVQGKVYMSKAESMRAVAHQTYLWSWAGYQPGDRLLQLGMTPNRKVFKSLKDIIFRTTYRPAFDINSDFIKADLKIISSQCEKYFFGGYASGLYEYTRIAQGLEIIDVRFKGVISWGDKMFSHYRSLIESQFHCKVFDTYGSTEGFVIAGQCEHGSYHILSPHVYLELVDENGEEVEIGDWGHVVVTRLDAYAMPLIRYRIGDLAIKEDPDKTCSCGRPFPMLKKIIGRDTDIVRTPSGKALIVHFFTGIFEHIEEIRQFQVVQASADFVVIRYISELSNEEIKQVLESVRNTMNEKAGEILNIQFERVDEIHPSLSGKPQIIISKLRKEGQ